MKGLLGGDGWEHATAYDHMVYCATAGVFVATLPQATTEDGVPFRYSRELDHRLLLMVDSRPRARAIGFACFMMAAYQRVAEALDQEA